jgi:membrane-associated HD superfamily phosphohydrolase
MILKNIKSKIEKLPKTMLYGGIILIIWEIILIWQRTHWTNYFLLISGAIVGVLIMEIDWFFPSKEVRRLLPLILLPITIFILTSTTGTLGKSIIVFVNLSLIVDQLKKNDRQN